MGGGATPKQKPMASGEAELGRHVCVVLLCGWQRGRVNTNAHARKRSDTFGTLRWGITSGSSMDHPKTMKNGGRF